MASINEEKVEDEATPLLPGDEAANNGGNRISLNTATQTTRHRKKIAVEIWHTWSRLIPFCIFNLGFASLLIYAKTSHSANPYLQALGNLKIGSQGHQLTSAAVALLLVSKVMLSVQRFNDINHHFATMCDTCRKIVDTTVILTSNEVTEEYQNWRGKVVYRALLLLRTTVAVLEFPVSGIPAWQVPELDGIELDKIREYACSPNLGDGATTQAQENLRVPVYVSYMLRQGIIHEGAALASPLSMETEEQLLELVDSMTAGYFSIQELLTTPPPFIYTETSRTLLCLYVFTLPLALDFLIDNGELSGLFTYILAIFLSTIVLFGLELISHRCDGNACSKIGLVHFHCLQMAQQAFEDAYLFVLDLDGNECADNLRYTMDDNVSKPLVRAESSWIFQHGSIGFRKDVKRRNYRDDSRWNLSLLAADFLPGDDLNRSKRQGGAS